MNKNIKEIIEAGVQNRHEVRADIAIAEQINNRVIGSVLVPSRFEEVKDGKLVRKTANVQQIRTADKMKCREVFERAGFSSGEAQQVCQIAEDTITPQATTEGDPDLSRCIQILQENGVSQEMSSQICQIAATALFEEQPNNQQQPPKPPGTPGGNVTQQGPPISGQIGSIVDSPCAKATKRKEIAKLQVIADRQSAELREYHAKVARIASLERLPKS